jgi:hypothetical protein
MAAGAVDSTFAVGAEHPVQDTGCDALIVADTYSYHFAD